MELHLNSIISKKPGNAKFPLIHKFYYTIGGKWPSPKRRTHQPMSLPSGDSYQLLTQSLALASWFTEEHCPNLYVVGWSPEHSKFINSFACEEKIKAERNAEKVEEILTYWFSWVAFSHSVQLFVYPAILHTCTFHVLMSFNLHPFIMQI